MRRIAPSTNPECPLMGIAVTPIVRFRVGRMGVDYTVVDCGKLLEKHAVDLMTNR